MRGRHTSGEIEFFVINITSTTIIATSNNNINRNNGNNYNNNGIFNHIQRNKERKTKHLNLKSLREVDCSK